MELSMSVDSKTVFLLFFLLINYTFASKSKNCTCVPYYQCSEETGALVMDGRDLFDIRNLNTNGCSGYYDVCCNSTNPPDSMNVIVHPKGCGYHKSDAVSWSGALFQQEASKNLRYICGASLIHGQAALTAAHCVYKFPKGLKIKMENITRDVKTVVLHPNFSSATLKNDIALLILSDVFEKNNIICVPPPGSVFDEQNCSVSVWTKNSTSRHLRFVNLPLVPSEKCQRSLRETRLGSFFHLHNSFLCAGGVPFEDTCGGDGGSPLLCPVTNQPGRYHQVGIVSWGIGCGGKNIPGVYVNLAVFRDWIDDTLLNNNLDINVYRY